MEATVATVIICTHTCFCSEGSFEDELEEHTGTRLQASSGFLLMSARGPV